MRKNYLIAGIVLLAAVGAFFVIQNKGGAIRQQVACTQEAKICSDGSAVGRQGPNCEFALCPDEIDQEIRVQAPRADAEVGLPLVISGEARVYESVFGYRLLSGTGAKLLQGFIEVQPPKAVNDFMPFEVQVNYADPYTATGTLELIEFDIKTGVEAEKVVLPIRFASIDAQEVSVYFNNQQKDPNSSLCEMTYPVKRRVARNSETPAEAVRELLRGPSALEGGMGYMTALHPMTQLVGLSIKKGVAHADFNDALQLGVAGSCRVGAIRSQIENTLKQFPEVKSVIISVNGRSEDVLQP